MQLWGGSCYRQLCSGSPGFQQASQIMSEETHPRPPEPPWLLIEAKAHTPEGWTQLNQRRYHWGLKAFWFCCNLQSNFTLGLTYKMKPDILSRILYKSQRFPGLFGDAAALHCTSVTAGGCFMAAAACGRGNIGTTWMDLVRDNSGSQSTTEQQEAAERTYSQLHSLSPSVGIFL